MSFESYTYFLEIDSGDYISVACLSDGRVYKIRDLVRKEATQMTQKYKVPADGYIGLDLMAKPRFRSLHGVTEAGTNRELFIGGFRGIDLSFEASGDEGLECVEVVVSADGKNMKLLCEGVDVTAKSKDYKDTELMGAGFITFYQQDSHPYLTLTQTHRLGVCRGSECVEVVVTADGKNMKLLCEGVDVTAKWKDYKDTELMGAGFITFYQQYGQACSFFRLTIEDLMARTSHGNRFLTRLIHPGAPANSNSGAKEKAVEPKSVPLPKPASTKPENAAPKSVPVTKGVPAAKQPLRQTTPDSAQPGAKKVKVEATAKAANPPAAAPATSPSVAQRPVTRGGVATDQATASKALPPSSSAPSGVHTEKQDKPKDADAAISPLVAMQLIQPLLDNLKASKDVRWAVGRDLSKMPAESLQAFMKLMTDAVRKGGTANSKLVLAFYFPGCGLD
eukprot:gene4329-14440_t